jgi:hypothetical protein
VSDPRRPSLPEDVDPRLWFEMLGCEGRHYLVDGNPHTFRGRMFFYCPRDDHYTRVSKTAITECSDETRYFIRGFLSGNEPPPPPDDLGSPESVAWRRAVEEFRRTGYWWSGAARTCDRCGDELLPSELGDGPCLACR